MNQIKNGWKQRAGLCGITSHVLQRSGATILVAVSHNGKATNTHYYPAKSNIRYSIPGDIRKVKYKSFAALSAYCIKHGTKHKNDIHPECKNV